MTVPGEPDGMPTIDLGELLGPDDLGHFTGAPFDAKTVADACAAVRGELGWHVAPVGTTEVLRSGTGGPRLVLPTLRVIDAEVWQVRTGQADRPLTGWRRGAKGMLIRDAGWPRGEDNLRVRITHGYDRCPDDLRPVVVELIRNLHAADTAPANVSAQTKTRGGVSTATTYRDLATAPPWSLAASAILDRFRV